MQSLSIIVFSAVSTWGPGVATRGTSACSSTYHLHLFIPIHSTTSDQVIQAGGAGDLHHPDLHVDRDQKINLYVGQAPPHLNLNLDLDLEEREREEVRQLQHLRRKRQNQMWIW